MSDATGLGLSPDWLNAKGTEIAEIDAQLDAASGTVSTHEKNYQREVAAQYSTQFEEQVSQLVDSAQNLSTVEQAALIFAVTNGLDNAYGSEVDKLVKEEAKRRAESVKPLSEEEATKLNDQRKTLKDQWDAAFALIQSFGMDVSGVVKPKSRRGKGPGKRGPRQLSRFTYKLFAGDVELPIEKDGLGPIAKTIFDLSVSDFKALIAEKSEEQGKKLDLTKAEELPDEWQVVLPHDSRDEGLLFKAVRMEEYRESDDDDEDENEETEVDVTDEDATEDENEEVEL